MKTKSIKKGGDANVRLLRQSILFVSRTVDFRRFVLGFTHSINKEKAYGC